MMSSDEDENGRIKKHKLPFSPVRKVTFDYNGKLINVNEPTFAKPQQIKPIANIKDYIDEGGSVYSGDTRKAASGKNSRRGSTKVA